MTWRANEQLLEGEIATRDLMVGKTGLEPATPRSQTECYYHLSYFPELARLGGFEPPLS